MKSKIKNQKSKIKNGYSMMEVLAAASIAAIIASVTGSAVGNFFSGQRVAAEACSFIQDVRAARYGAMGSQAYHRVFFTDDGLGYLVQTYINTGTVPSGDILAAQTVESNPDWLSIIESERREIDPRITFEKPSGLKVIFMSPDGLLVDTPNENGPPIGDYIATFTYGESIMTVNINANGIAASYEFYEEY